MQGILFIALGGALGAILRFSVAEIVFKITGISFPWGTIAANLIGCFLIGFMWGIFNTFDLGNNARMFVFTGVLGAFTTFSTFALENFTLLRDNNFSLLTLNIGISNIAGVFLVFAGFYMSKLLFTNAK